MDRSNQKASEQPTASATCRVDHRLHSHFPFSIPKRAAQSSAMTERIRPLSPITELTSPRASKQFFDEDIASKDVYVVSPTSASSEGASLSRSNSREPVQKRPYFQPRSPASTRVYAPMSPTSPGGYHYAVPTLSLPPPSRPRPRRQHFAQLGGDGRGPPLPVRSSSLSYRKATPQQIRQATIPPSLIPVRSSSIPRGRESTESLLVRECVAPF